MADELSGAPASAPGGDVGTPPPSAPVGAPPAPASAGQPDGQPAQYTYKEDRTNWVPSHVVRQRSEELDRVRQEAALWRSRTEALSGVKAPVTPDPESDGVRAQFAKLFPGLAKLETMADKLERAAAFDYEGVQSSQQQVWVAHGNQVLQTLSEKVKAAYGGADLSPKALQRIQRSFVNEVAEDPQMQARYSAGDLTILDEFIKDYTAGVLDPYRRSTAAAAQPGNPAARRLPRGGGGSAVIGGQPPPTVKPSDGDAYHKAAYDRFVQEGK